MRSAKQSALGTFKCPGSFPSLCSEQGIVSLAPLCRYTLKAKDVTTFVTPFAYFTVLRTMPEIASVFAGGRKSPSAYARYGDPRRSKGPYRMAEVPALFAVKTMLAQEPSAHPASHPTRKKYALF